VLDPDEIAGGRGDATICGASGTSDQKCPKLVEAVNRRAQRRSATGSGSGRVTRSPSTPTTRRSASAGSKTPRRAGSRGSGRCAGFGATMAPAPMRSPSAARNASSRRAGPRDAALVVFDSRALLACLGGERAAGRVESAWLDEGAAISSINLGEVLYIRMRQDGEESAVATVDRVHGLLEVIDPDWPLVSPPASIEAGAAFSYASPRQPAASDPYARPVLAADEELRRVPNTTLRPAIGRWRREYCPVWRPHIASTTSVRRPRIKIPAYGANNRP
jgi:hypothetical protein